MKIIQFSFDADITKHKVKKNQKNQKGDYIIEGYVMTSDIDSGNTIITDEAIKHSKNDLLKYSTVLFNHNMDRPIGKVLETDFDKKGLWVRMKLSKSEPKIWNKVQEGIISKFSIKGKVVKDAIEEINPKKKKKGDDAEDESSMRYRMFMNPDKFVRKITRLELYEASLVSVPANVKAKAINWYISKSLDLAEKKITKKMKKQEKITKKMTIRKGIIGELKSLADRLKNNDSKNVINETINILNKSNNKKSILGLSDTSDNIYEINNSDTIELDGNRFRKQLLKKGQWYHWDAEGGILDITKNAISKIVKNYKNKTIEHVYVPLTHSTNPAKNTGEVVDLIQTKDGLDAICEIKDKKVVKKIKDGLIKCVSASIDEDYMEKKKGTCVGPTLLHAALVAEPYIKGMSGFTELSEESNKNIVALSDSKPTVKDINDLKKFKKKLKKKTNKKEESNKMKKIKKVDKKVKKKVVKKSKYTKCIGKEMKAGKTMAEAAKICKKEPEKEPEKKGKKVDKKVNKKVDKTIKKIKKKVMKKIKKSKTIKKDNKVKVKSLEDKISKALGVKSKAILKKSRSKAVVSKKRVDLAEAERVYFEYLGKGKVVPAQKDVVISLLTSKTDVNLGDGEQVDIKKVLTSFLDKQPKIVDFGEKGTQETTKLKKQKSKIVPQDVKDFYGNMGLDKDQTRDAWKYAKNAANKAKEDKSTLF